METTKSIVGTPDNLQNVLASAREAFELFERQTGLLESSFSYLEKDLARSSGALRLADDSLREKDKESKRVLTHLHSVLESLSDGVFVVDSNGLVEFANSSVRKFFGETRALAGSLYVDVVTVPFQKDRLKGVLETARADLHREFEMGSAQTGRVLLQSSMSPVISDNGDVLGVVEILRDITQQRQVDRQLKHHRHMAALGEMAAGVAHEIRNPLGSIEGFALLLKKDLDRSGLDSHSRLAERIVQGAENLNYVVSNLLDYARPVRLQYEMFSVHSLLCSLRDCLTGVVREKQVDLVIQDPGEEMQMRGDLRQLRHVLINLGRNAVEACVPGEKVHVEFFIYQSEVAFHISDNGCGIDAPDLERIFDPFFTTKSAGTGLGLSFCHKIVEAHGGEIMVHSDKSNGTVFQVIIPMWRNSI